MKNLKKIVKAIRPLKNHSVFLDSQEKTASDIFDIIVTKMIDACAAALSKEKMAKSDKETKLPSKWLEEVPLIKLDVNKVVEPIIEKYLLALRYALLGSAAGEDAIEAVKELNLFRVLPKGLIIQSFAHSIDSHKDYLSEILQLQRPRINSEWMDLTLKFIEEKSGRFVDKALYDMKAKAMAEIDKLVLDKNMQNSLEAARSSHDLIGQMKAIDKKRDAVKDAVKKISEHKISLSAAKQALKDSFKDSASNWDMIVRTESSMASNVAATQTIIDLVSKTNDDPIVSIVDMGDSRVSEVCKKWSRDENGHLKYFRLSNLKPPGYNLGLKKKDWENCIPVRHVNCFTADTKILTTNGLISIKDLCKGNVTLTADGLCINVDGIIQVIVDGRLVGYKKTNKSVIERHFRNPNKIMNASEAYFAGIQKTYKFILSSGHEIEVSEGHEMIVDDGKTGIRVKASDIILGQNIPIQAKVGGFGKINFEKIAELMGNCLGDGSYNEDGISWNFFGEEIEYGEKLFSYAREIYDSSTSTEEITFRIQENYEKYTVKNAIFTGKYIHRIFHNMGFQFKNLGYKVPSSIWTSDEKTIGAFLRGLYSADGHITASKDKDGNIVGQIIGLSSKEKNLLIEIQILLNNFGIISRIYKHDEEHDKVITYNDGRQFNTHRSSTWRLYIADTQSCHIFKDKIGFGPRVKQEKMNEILKHTKKGKTIGHRVGKVIEIIDMGEKEVYGITVPGKNSVIANGVVTGNCRCSIVYIPKGYRLDNYGSLVKLEKDEELKIDN